MRSSWADLAANSAAENIQPTSAVNNANNTQSASRPVYVPPHLRNRGPTAPETCLSMAISHE